MQLCPCRAPAYTKRFALDEHSTCHNFTLVKHAPYLVEFLKLHHLEENVLQDVLGIPLCVVQFGSHAQDFTTFPYIELEVVVGACERSHWSVSART